MRSGTRLCMVGVLLALTGCMNMTSLMQALQERQVTSCLYYQGMAGIYGSVRGVTATGGATLEQCERLR